jgi:hypothetical protein
MTELVQDYCCTKTSEQLHPKKIKCPSNGINYGEVSRKTIGQHIKHPWDLDAKERRYFFCDDPDCDIVYFSEDGLTVKQQEIRTPIGVKDKSDEATLCYCFGVTRAEVFNDPSIMNFIITQTKEHLCSCDTRNPSGICCLKNFPRQR